MQTQPKRTGIVALVEVGLLFVRDEIVYPWLGEEDGRKYVPFFWTLFFFILLSNVLGMLPFPFNIWHRTATTTASGATTASVISRLAASASRAANSVEIPPRCPRAASGICWFG